MKVYAVHTSIVRTQDLLAMLEKFPKAAEYGDFRLFGEVHPNPKQPVVDLSPNTLDEFKAAYEQLKAKPEHEGVWVHINHEQGMYLLDTDYKVEEDEL